MRGRPNFFDGTYKECSICRNKKVITEFYLHKEIKRNESLTSRHLKPACIPCYNLKNNLIKTGNKKSEMRECGECSTLNYSSRQNCKQCGFPMENESAAS